MYDLFILGIASLKMVQLNKDVGWSVAGTCWSFRRARKEVLHQLLFSLLLSVPAIKDFLQIFIWSLKKNFSLKLSK